MRDDTKIWFHLRMRQSPVRMIHLSRTRKAHNLQISHFTPLTMRILLLFIALISLTSASRPSALEDKPRGLRGSGQGTQANGSRNLDYYDDDEGEPYDEDEDDYYDDDEELDESEDFDDYYDDEGEFFC